MITCKPSTKMAFHRRMKKELEELHHKSPQGITLDETSMKDRLDRYDCVLRWRYSLVLGSCHLEEY